MQTKKGSLIEITTGTVVAMTIAYLTQIIVFPLMSIEVQPHQNFQLVVIFTVVSMIRSYFWRRFFNWLKLKGVVE